MEKIKKSKVSANFLGNNAASGKTLYKFHIVEKCAKYCLDPESEPEQKLYRSRNRNRNKSLRFHNTVWEDKKSLKSFRVFRKFCELKKLYQEPIDGSVR
jgi:hypothetical protein